MALAVARFLCALSLVTCTASLRASSIIDGKRNYSCPLFCSPDDCGQPDWADIDRPIKQVLAEKPEVIGFCYFSQFDAYWMRHEVKHAPKHTNDYLDSRPHNLDQHSMHSEGRNMRMYDDRLKEMWRWLPNSTLSYTDGNETIELKSRLPDSNKSFQALYVNKKIEDWHTDLAYEIPYYYSLGWLRNQRDDFIIQDEDFYQDWVNLAAKECQKIKEEENFNDYAFTFRELNEDDRTMTTHAFKKRAYARCLMGAAPNDLMYAHFAVGCVLPQNKTNIATGHYIGHGEVECMGGYHAGFKAFE